MSLILTQRKVKNNKLYLQPRIDLLSHKNYNKAQQFFFEQTPENNFYQYHYYN